MNSSIRLLLYLLLAAFAFWGVLFPLVNTDIWWHLAAGRTMWHEGGFLSQDPYSISSAGQSWLNLHWLFQISSYGAWNLGGTTALVLGKCALFSTAVLVLLKASQTAAGQPGKSDSRLALPMAIVILALIVMAGRHLVLARPVVFSLLYMSIYFLVLERYLRHGRTWTLAILIPVQIMWANTQALFILGPLIMGCFIAGEGLAALLVRFGCPGFHSRLPGRALLVLSGSLVLICLSCALTPYGFQTWLVPFKLFLRMEPGAAALFSWNVSENIPPLFLERAGSGPVAAFKWVCLAGAASFLLNLKRISLWRVFIFSALLVSALMANRNILLFYWVAALVAIANVGGALNNRLEPSGPTWSARLVSSPIIAVLSLTLLSWPLLSAMEHDGPITQPGPFRVPTQSLAHMDKLPGPMRVFSSARYGGALIWACHPKCKPYMDGRFILRPADQFREYLLSLDDGQIFEALDKRISFNAALLPVAQPDRYQSLIARLYQDQRWQLTFSDGTETLFIKASPGQDAGVDLSSQATVAHISQGIRARFQSAPLAREHGLANLGLLLNLTGQPQRAEEVLTGLKSLRARNLLARALLVNNKRQEAQALAEQLVRDAPQDTDSLVLLAWIAYDKGNLQQAARWAERALEQNPHSPEAIDILKGIQASLH